MSPGEIVGAAIALAFVAWGAWYAGRAWLLARRLGGDRLVTCPETGKPAAVRIDIPSAITGSSRSARLESCSRWGERGRCDQPCTADALDSASAPATLVREWAKERHCVMCGTPVRESATTGRHVALLDPSGNTREWVDVAADSLPLALATCLPVCWNCHTAEKFRRLHPELVTERDGAVVRVRP